MSKDNVKQMFGKIEKDAALKAEYARLMQAHQIETEKKLSDKLIEFGKTSGFAFSKDDLMAARAEIIDKSNSNKELSQDDLDNVAGGVKDGYKKFALISTSISSLGVVCALLSVTNEAMSPHGGCGKFMSTTTKCQ